MIDAWVAPILNRLQGIKTKNDEILSGVNEVKGKQDGLQGVVAKESTSQEIAQNINTIGLVTKDGAEFYQQIHTSTKTFVPDTDKMNAMLFDDKYYYVPSKTTLYVYDLKNHELVASISQSQDTLLPMEGLTQNEEYVICSGSYYDGGGSNSYYGSTVVSKKTLSIVFSNRLSYAQTACIFDVLTNPDNNNEIYFTYYHSGSRNSSYYLAKATMFTTTYTGISIPNYENYGSALSFFSSSRMYAEGEDLLFLIGGSQIFKLNRNNLSVSHGSILSCSMNTTLHIDQKYVLCYGNILRCYDNNFDLTRKICFNPSLTIVSTAYINGLVILNASYGITPTSNTNTCIVLNSDLTHIVKYYTGDKYQYCDGEYVYISANGGFELTALTECNIAV